MFKIGNVEIKNRIIVAPLAGVSNVAFRMINHDMGAGLCVSEMISAMGIIYNSKKTIDLLEICEEERPVSIQLFGSDENSLLKAAKYVEDNIKPDIIDINCGCPVPKVAGKSGGGAALMKDPDKIYKIVYTLSHYLKTPITIKIRIGWDSNSINAVEIAKKAELAGASGIAIHGRTKAQGYEGSANWDIIKEVKESVNIPVIGNGDIKTIYDAKRMLDYTKCDAVMIGRASLGNPWFIKECVEYVENGNIIEKPTYIDKLGMIKTHYEKLESIHGPSRAILEIRSHALWYLKGLVGNKEIKEKIVHVNTKAELFDIIDKYKKELGEKNE